MLVDKKYFKANLHKASQDSEDIGHILRFALHTIEVKHISHTTDVYH